MDKGKYDNRRLAIVGALATMGVGCSLLVASLAIPPPGEIDNSVLVAFGEISTFSATLLVSNTRQKEQGEENAKDR